MGEVKRYDVAEATTDEWGYHVPSRMEEYPNGEYVEHSDYARLEREHAAAQAELTRLRAVEAAAVALLDALQEMQFDQFTVISAPRVRVDALAEAVAATSGAGSLCGRKG
jgi:hypothetical protein